ncbi:prephenate dehydratase [Bailinhaonella thermotolerans]|uniref:Prephenate dehydratase n=1 Tax=Bailinhaonella thermotolerans TaxID=1070861 RepID=A0A3A4B2J9_9ACTN|nr:prephenate dehydratase [Bailinhaonella thermotolerans]RJL32217.1 prephenate dehydratase [Bailinhaonella thermotolerans]
MSTLAYLGPEGTFTEAALRSFAPDAPRIPCATVGAAFDAVRRGEADGAVVPLENSVEGAVNATLDELAAGEPLLIHGEVLLPVSFALLARPETELEDVKRVVTHPHAHAQCRGFLAGTLPRAEVFTAASTAAAAMAVSDPTSHYDAAIAAPIAGEHYGLRALATGIGDRPDTVTRFVVVRRPGPLPPPSGADRTTLVAFIADDHPGALLEILFEFAVRGVSLTRIESRPTGDGIGRYFFHIDCEGHVSDARVGEALTGLRRICANVRFLGSYRRADGAAPTLRPGTTDPDFTRAAAWLTSIRAGQV